MSELVPTVFLPAESAIISLTPTFQKLLSLWKIPRRYLRFVRKLVCLAKVVRQKKIQVFYLRAETIINPVKKKDERAN